MSDIGACYFNHSTPHLARLVVSLWSLRKHYSGPVAILDTGFSEGIIEKIAADARLNVEVVKIPFVQRRRNSCYCMKASLWRHVPYESFLFLDADTVVVRSIDPLLSIIQDKKNAPFFVTRFSNWVTTGDIIRKRIEQWHGVVVGSDPHKGHRSIDVEGLIKASFEADHAAVNTGVFGTRISDAKLTLKTWERLTHAGWKCSFTDELSCQILLRKVPHTLLSDRFNCSPLYGVEKDKAVIFHPHGSKHVIREDGRGAEGHKIWFPIFCEAMTANAGGISQWAPAGDCRLARHLPLAQV